MHKRKLYIVFFLLTLSLLAAQEAIITSAYSLDGKGRGYLQVTYEIPSGLHQIDSRDFFSFALSSPGDFELGDIEYPPTRSYGSFEGYEGTVILKAPLRKLTDGPPPAEGIGITAGYQLCDEKGTCFRPLKKDILSQPGDVSLPPPPAKSGGNLALFLLFAFLGGVILNIMPCVLPVLSLKALHLVGQSGDSRRAILLNSLSYTGGILTSFLILGFTVILIKASGTALGWGFQFQNPHFVLILTGIIFLFSLSLFEVFFINPPRGAGEAASRHKSGFGGSFLTGIMAVLLATPCTAPLLGSALGFAFVQTGGIILLFFLLIGLGLALPFILLGFIPGIINRLPKPGEWMNRFREIMGFLLAGTAVYLLTVLHRQTGKGFTGILWFMLILAASAWIFGQGQRSGRRSRFALYALSLLLAAGSYLLFVDVSTQPSETLPAADREEYLPFSPEGVEEIRREGKPLFLEFTADWCATCRSNHLTVLDRDFRKELFEDEGVLYMVGDYTLNDPVISSWLTKFNRAGVPLYVYYPRGGEPVVLPEVLTRRLLENSIRGR